MDRPLSDRLYRADQVQALDRRAIDEQGIAGYQLMQRAGHAAFECVRRLAARAPSGGDDPPRILVVCGGGNNGGDGYVVARLARESGHPVDVLSLAPPEKLKGDAFTAMRDWRDGGGVAVDFDNVDFTAYSVIVDALLGTGLQRAVAGRFADAVHAINAAGVPVLAVDIPSGLSADTGQPLGIAVRAAMTATFVGMKRGLLTGAAAEYCGEIVFDRLSLPDTVYQNTTPAAHRLGRRDLAAALPPRRRTSHKGDFGHVLVVGGDRGMAGAVLMAAMAALRTGAGLVSVGTRVDHAAGLSWRQPELMAHGVEQPAALDPLLHKATIVAVGPGLGQGAWARGLWARLLESRLPLVVDADALNLLAADPCRRGRWILTPHPGEAARLLDTDTATVQADRFAAVARLAEQYAACVVLKGAGTLVAAGQTGDISVCDRGHPGMASGGMGDILTGMIAGVAAQCTDLPQAARGAVWLHATAGDKAADNGERGIVATDLLHPLGEILNGNV